MEPTDAALFERWKETRNADAFSELMARHTSMVYATALRILRNGAEAEDVTQECFFRLSQQNRPAHTSVAGWLHRIAANRSIDVLRSRQSDQSRIDSLAPLSPTWTDPAWAEVEAVLDEEIAALPEELRLPIVLHFFEGKTHAVVAAELNTSRPTVTRRIHEATDTLRERLIKRGIALTAAALVTSLAALEATAAPATLTTRLGKRLLVSDVAAKKVATGAWGVGALASMAAAICVALSAGFAFYAYVRPTNESLAPSSPSAIATAVPRPASLEQGELHAPNTMPASTGVSGHFARLRCVDEEAHPIAGVEVYALTISMAKNNVAMGPEDYTRDEDGPLLSDGDGFVSIPLHESAAVADAPFVYAYARVTGRLAGCWAGAAIDSPESHTMVLKPSRELTGTLTVPEHFRVQDIRLEVFGIRFPTEGYPGFQFYCPSPRTYEGSVWTNEPIFPRFFAATIAADGTFRITDLPADSQIYLGANGDGLAEAQVLVNESSAGTDIGIDMVREGVITGFVRRGSTGRPVGNALVCVRSIDLVDIMSRGFYGKTKPDGTYRIDGLAAAAYSVTVCDLEDAICAPVANARVVSAMATEADDLFIEDGTLLSGRIVTSDTKEPIAGVQLNAQFCADWGTAPCGWAETDAEGRFAVRVPAGELELFFTSPQPPGIVIPEDYGKMLIEVARKQSHLEVADMELSRVPIPVQTQQSGAIATVTGRVVDDANAPLENAVIYDMFWPEADILRVTPAKAGTTGPDGAFSIQVSPAGKHRIYVGKKGYTKLTTAWLVVRADETRDLPDFHLNPAHSWIAGVVTDETGMPFNNALVRVTNPHAYLDPVVVHTGIDGAFRIDGLPEEEIAFNVSASGYEEQTLHGEPNTEYTVSLKPNSALAP